jgi:aerobactin synthase
MSLTQSAEPGASAAAELASAHWRVAGRALLARMIAELAYEEMLVPAPATPAECGTFEGAEPRATPESPTLDGGVWRLELPGGVAYTFRARRATFGAWRIEDSTLTRWAAGACQPADDPIQFALDARATIGLTGPVVAELVRDLIATQVADVRLREKALRVEDLVELSHEDIESHQSGHPCLFLNKGRLGFSAADAARYTPEAAGAFRLVWIAVSPELGRFQCMNTLDRDRLLTGELDEETRAAFAERIRAAGGDPDAYLWLPVHPFQWDEVVLPLYAPQLAKGELVLLGDSPDRYRPLQSVRTLTNLDNPQRRNVKVSLMIRNTLVWRGLSSMEAGCAPYVTTWLQGLREADPFLRDECRIAMLGEVASVTVPHPVFTDVPDAPYRFHELLGAIWREPVASYLEPGERARTMASLLLEDADGRAFVAELVRRSGLDALSWLRAYLAALLRPVLHYLYRYGICFTPHGENVVLIFDERDVPVRIALKDFGADVELLTTDLPEYDLLPEHVRTQLHRWSAGELAHSVLSAICAGLFRFFAPIVEAQLGVPEQEFWALVRAEIVAYHGRFPELAERFEWFGLLNPTFGRVSLNREQLLGGGFHDRAERDGEFDVIDGVLENPLYHRGA